jgi:hypothetical protein
MTEKIYFLAITIKKHLGISKEYTKSVWRNVWKETWVMEKHTIFLGRKNGVMVILIAILFICTIIARKYRQNRMCRKQTHWLQSLYLTANNLIKVHCMHIWKLSQWNPFAQLIYTNKKVLNVNSKHCWDYKQKDGEKATLSEVKRFFFKIL